MNAPVHPDSACPELGIGIVATAINRSGLASDVWQDWRGEPFPCRLGLFAGKNSINSENRTPYLLVRKLPARASGEHGSLCFWTQVEAITEPASELSEPDWGAECR